MSVSYNHAYIALYTNNGIVWMGSSDLETKFCEFNTGRTERLLQISWILDSENCRSADAIVITYPSLLIVISVAGDSNLYCYDPAIFLIPEMDGVRVLTNNCHEMIQKVPKCVNNIFAINSQESSSWLFEAHKKYLVSKIYIQFVLAWLSQSRCSFFFTSKQRLDSEFRLITRAIVNATTRKQILSH